VRLYVLDTGLIESTDYAMWSPTADPGSYGELSVRSYLIVHPQGAMLWDTGIDDGVAGAPTGRRIAPTIVFRVPRTLRGQLDEIGIAPGDIDYLGLSHLHVDHVGNVDLVPRATVLLQRAEFDAGFGPDPQRFTLDPAAYAALDPAWINTVDGEHDVFGDGLVTTLSLPGHTPGHQGLLVMLPQTGPVLLAGDVAYSARDYAQAAVRAGNVDIEASRLSIERTQTIERELGATVWLHHDLDAQRAIQTAPYAYR